mmetsp:Transcript_17608/g.61960  ORF Transcript_17608/g.61960 Transcript_17608/m.61960 type:complete len:401 (+) Transcript_17608:481-1683(+)
MPVARRARRRRRRGRRRCFGAEVRVGGAARTVHVLVLVVAAARAARAAISLGPRRRRRRRLPCARRRRPVADRHEVLGRRRRLHHVRERVPTEGVLQQRLHGGGEARAHAAELLHAVLALLRHGLRLLQLGLIALGGLAAAAEGHAELREAREGVLLRPAQRVDERCLLRVVQAAHHDHVERDEAQAVVARRVVQRLLHLLQKLLGLDDGALVRDAAHDGLLGRRDLEPVASHDERVALLHQVRVRAGATLRPQVHAQPADGRRELVEAHARLVALQPCSVGAAQREHLVVDDGHHLGHVRVPVLHPHRVVLVQTQLRVPVAAAAAGAQHDRIAGRHVEGLVHGGLVGEVVHERRAQVRQAADERDRAAPPHVHHAMVPEGAVLAHMVVHEGLQHGCQLR